MLDVVDHGAVRVLRMRRPERRNAIDATLATSLREALDQAIADDVRAVVLTGTDTSFCAGVDLEYLTALARREADGTPMVMFNETLQTYPLPLLAAVNGAAVGVGATLCLHTDLVIAARSARFRMPFAELGVGPELGSSWLLPQQVGHQAASWMLLSSAWVDADEALARGLVLDVVDDDQLLEHTIERARQIAALDPEAVRAAKRTVRAWRDPGIATAIAVENDEFSVLLARRAQAE
ncbi:MAG: enoyl-CoA hydratase/isomerase family protein [Acidimicrobiia bacterium]|nr:enoyl-CoA hydratase/isomerase family protein [Acidimicrobiia bacterium]